MRTFHIRYRASARGTERVRSRASARGTERVRSRASARHCPYPSVLRWPGQPVAPRFIVGVPYQHKSVNAVGAGLAPALLLPI